MIIQVCVGSSYHLKGSPEIVQLMQDAIVSQHLEQRVTLAGCFCLGKCSPTGVSVQIDEEVFTGINRINFKEFFKSQVLDVLHISSGKSDDCVLHSHPLSAPYEHRATQTFASQLTI